MYIIPSLLYSSSSRHHNNDRTSDKNDNDVDVWSVSMACLLLACKLHDISTNQICIYDIIYTFCVVIYRQRILLPKFIPAIPLTTTNTTQTAATTIDVIAKQKEYYTKNILPFVPNKWQQLSTMEQHQILNQQSIDTPAGTGNMTNSTSNATTNNNNTAAAATTFLSKSGPLYTEWFNAMLHMECQILYTLQYRIYDIPHRPSIYHYIPILAQRYIHHIKQQQQQRPSASTDKNTSNNTNSSAITTEHDPTQLLLSTITTQAYEYCRIATQIIIAAENDDDDDNHHCPKDIQLDHRDATTTTTTTSTITIPQIIACACLYCSVVTLDLDGDMVQKNTNHHRNNAITNYKNAGTTSTNDDFQGNHNSINHSFDDRWKRLLFPLTSQDDRRTTNYLNTNDDEYQWSSIQHDMNEFVRMLCKTTSDPNYYIAQSNYCSLGLETTRPPTTTTTKTCFHGSDSYTWHRCITNII